MVTTGMQYLLPNLPMCRYELPQLINQISTNIHDHYITITKIIGLR